MATPLLDAEWANGAYQLMKYGMVVACFYDIQHVQKAGEAVLRLVNGVDVVDGKQVKSMFRNGALAHASSFHGHHRIVPERIYDQVVKTLMFHITELSPRTIQMLPFQVHYRENSLDTIDAWSFTKTPDAHDLDLIYLSFVNLNTFNMYMDVVPSSHEVENWGGHVLGIADFTDDPNDIEAYKHLVFTPPDMASTLDEQKQTILVPPGHVLVYSSKLVTREPYTDKCNMAQPSLYITMACRVTDSTAPLYHSILTDLEKQAVPITHTGSRPSLYASNEPFRRPDVFRDTFGTPKKPLMFKNQFMVKWAVPKSRQLYFPERVAVGLAGSGYETNGYSDWEISLYTGRDNIDEDESTIINDL